jgi:hypothetical protein
MNAKYAGGVVRLGVLYQRDQIAQDQFWSEEIHPGCRGHTQDAVCMADGQRLEVIGTRDPELSMF